MTEWELKQILDRTPEGIDIFNRLVGEKHAHHEQVPKDRSCVIVGGSDVVPGMAGSKRADCDVCKAHIWLAPHTQQMMAGRTAKTELLCPACAVERIKREKGYTVTY